jgi:histidinol-phosphate/aromatic aminotransferase/cobyric acid decarboxylase-like protein
MTASLSRTFSKVFGLAGMRVGYAVGASEKIQALSAHRLAEGLNAVGARAALVAYDDFEYVQMSEKRNAVAFGTPPQMTEFWRVWDLMPAQKS